MVKERGEGAGSEPDAQHAAGKIRGGWRRRPRSWRNPRRRRGVQFSGEQTLRSQCGRRRCRHRPHVLEADRHRIMPKVAVVVVAAAAAAAAPDAYLSTVHPLGCVRSSAATTAVTRVVCQPLLDLIVGARRFKFQTESCAQDIGCRDSRMNDSITRDGGIQGKRVMVWWSPPGRTLSRYNARHGPCAVTLTRPGCSGRRTLDRICRWFRV